MWICPECKAEYKSKIDVYCPACKFGIVVTEECYRMCEEHKRKFKEKQEIVKEFVDYIDAGLEMPEHIEEQIADMYATMEDLIPDFAEEQIADEQMKKTVEELNAAIKDLVPEMPHHPNCSCANCNNSEHLTNLSRNAYGNIVEGVPQLSFDDLEINEKLLISLPLEDASNNYNAQATCITEMNERFLHTFIDDCFVP